ncbi:MAG: twin-arginine translocase TatA/TatE family subunit [Thermaerobacter sp.]|nr:twin-arginine translocase TatA/TatE family subunit [Thermaerobacter sp.]
MFGDLFTPFHLIVLLAIALLVFGPRKLPEIGSGIGKGIQEFRRAMSSIQGEVLPHQVDEPPANEAGRNSETPK